MGRESRVNWCWTEGFWASLGDEATTEVMESKETSFLVNRLLQWTLGISSESLYPFPVLPRCGSDVCVLDHVRRTVLMYHCCESPSKEIYSYYNLKRKCDSW